MKFHKFYQCKFGPIKQSRIIFMGAEKPTQQTSVEAVKEAKEKAAAAIVLKKTQEMVEGLESSPAYEHAKTFLGEQEAKSYIKKIRDKVLTADGKNLGDRLTTKWEKILKEDGTANQKGQRLMNLISGGKSMVMNQMVEKADKVRVNRRNAIDGYIKEFGFNAGRKANIKSLLMKSLGRTEEQGVEKELKIAVARGEKYGKDMLSGKRQDLLINAKVFKVNDAGEVTGINTNCDQINKIFEDIDSNMEETINRIADQKTSMSKEGASFYGVGSAIETKGSIKATGDYLTKSLEEKGKLLEKLENGGTVQIQIDAYTSVDGSIGINNRLRRQRGAAKKTVVLNALKKMLGKDWAKYKNQIKIKVNATESKDPKLTQEDLPKVKKEAGGNMVGWLKGNMKKYPALSVLKPFLKDGQNDKDLMNLVNKNLKGEKKLHFIITLLSFGQAKPRAVMSEFNKFMNEFAKSPEKGEIWIRNNSKYLKNNRRLLRYLFKYVGAARSTDVKVLEDTAPVKDAKESKENNKKAKKPEKKKKKRTLRKQKKTIKKSNVSAKNENPEENTNASDPEIRASQNRDLDRVVAEKQGKVKAQYRALSREADRIARSGKTGLSFTKLWGGKGEVKKTGLYTKIAGKDFLVGVMTVDGRGPNTHISVDYAGSSKKKGGTSFIYANNRYPHGRLVGVLKDMFG